MHKILYLFIYLYIIHLSAVFFPLYLFFTAPLIHT